MHAQLAGHDTDIAIPSVRRDDEIGEMARAVSVFRDNAVALVNSQRRLIEQAAALEAGLENERRLTAQQRDFVSMTSHEFRTPLTIIDGHAQRLIKASDRLDPRTSQSAAPASAAPCSESPNIMDSLLGGVTASGWARGVSPERRRSAARSCAMRVKRIAMRRAAQSSTRTSPRCRRLIEGDRKLLFHAFSNLISNAIKYSPPGSPIEVVARQEVRVAGRASARPRHRHSGARS